MAFPRAEILDRLDKNVETLIGTLGAGRAAKTQFLAEINSPGASGKASPFLKSLFPEVGLAATIERSLITSLGRGWDHMAASVARAAYGGGTAGVFVTGTIPAVTENAINDIVLAYTSGSGHPSPDTSKELKAILPTVTFPGARATVREKDDLFFTRATVENHIEIKTPKLNYDQGRAAKRRILRIHAVKAPTVVEVFVGLPYNPNGLFGVYQWPTTKYFLDPSRDLKIGREFWNYVGDSSDTYEELLDCFLTVANARRTDLIKLLEEV